MKDAFDKILNWRIVREFAHPYFRKAAKTVVTADVVSDPKYPPNDIPEPEDAPFEADEEQENKR
jgi:hypothetical protein